MPGVVLDASDVIGVARCDVFEHHASLFSRVVVPPAVVQEIVVQGRERPGAVELRRALGDWVTQVTPQPSGIPQLPPALSLSDCEILALALEIAADEILTGDRLLQREAATLGVSCLTTAEVVVIMKLEGLIPSARAALDLGHRQGFGISALDYQQALADAGE